MRRDFLQFLGECNGGAFATDCSERLEEVVKAVEETGNAGALQIELKISPNGDGTASVFATLKMKKPGKRRAPSVFFMHQDALHLKHTNQMSMFEGDNVRSIEDGPRKVKEV